MAYGVTIQQPVPMQNFGLQTVPMSIQYLGSIDQLIIKQKKEMFEILTGCESKNKYDVFNEHSQQVFYCFEESEDCHRIMCGPSRGFIFHIQDNNGQEILTIERPFQCCKGGCTPCADGCCAYPMYIYDSQKTKIGMMRVTNFCCAPRFGIFDTNDEQIYAISGDMCMCQGVCCKSDINFPITSFNTGTQVANLAKRWAGAIQEMFTDADTFAITFPIDLNITHKALLFASTFLVEMTLFENNNQ